MSNPSAEALQRQAAEAEAGMPISAGARIAHVRLALGAERSYVVNLGEIPEERRPVVMAQINELIRRAAQDARASQQGQLAPSPPSS